MPTRYAPAMGCDDPRSRKAPGRLMAILALTALFFLPSSALAQGGMSAAETNVLQAEKMFQEAKRHVSSGQYRHAEGLLGGILSMAFPGDDSARQLKAGAHVSLAEVQLLQNKLPEAESTAGGGLYLTGSDANPTYLRAELLEMLARIADAQGSGDRASEFRTRAAACRGRSR